MFYMLFACLLLASCSKDYDDRFDVLEQRIKDVLAQVEGATELSNAINAAEAQIASLQNAINGLPDADALGAGLGEIGVGIKDLENQLANVGENQATSEELSLLIGGLTADLGILKEDLNALMESNNVLTGDLVIFSQSSLDAALVLGDKVRIVTGSVRVVANDLNAEDVNKVTSKIVAVTNDVYVLTDKSLDFSKLESIGDDLGLVGHDVDLSGLKVVGSDFQISYDGDYDFPNLKFVGNTLGLGIVPESDRYFTKGESNDKATPRTIDFSAVSASRVTVYENVEMGVDDGVVDMQFSGTELNYVYLPNATSIIFGNVALTDVWAPIASTIELHYEGTLKKTTAEGRERSLYILAALAENITVKASGAEHDFIIITGPIAEEDIVWNSFLGTYLSMDIAFAALDSFLEANHDDEGEFVYPEALSSWTSEINLPALESAEESLFLISASLTMPVLTEIKEDKQVVLSQNVIDLPNLAVQGGFIGYAPLSVEFASLNLAAFDFYSDARLKTLSLYEQDNSFTANTVAADLFLGLESLEIYGAEGLADAIEVEIRPQGEIQKYRNLETVKIGGVLNKASFGPFNNAYENQNRRLPKLRSIVTEGRIDNLIIRNLDELVVAEIGHDYISGNAGSKLQVWNNKKLERLETSKLDFIQTLRVYDNLALTTIDFSSVKNAVLQGKTIITIENNALEGVLDDYIPQTGTTPEVLGSLTSSSLYSLKGLIQSLKTKALAQDVDTAELLDKQKFRLDIDNVDDIDTEDTEAATFPIFSLDFFTWSDTANVITFDQQPL